MDKSGANKAGIDAVNFQLMIFILLGFSLNLITVQQVKYLNNIIEQDHRGIKRIADPMMGF
jgi:putative transposase